MAPNVHVLKHDIRNRNLIAITSRENSDTYCIVTSALSVIRTAMHQDNPSGSTTLRDLSKRQTELEIICVSRFMLLMCALCVAPVFAIIILVTINFGCVPFGHCQ